MSLSRNPSPRRPPAPTRASSRSGYNSRAPSRPRASRNSSRASLAYLPQGGEVLILPDGPIGEEAAELLQDFVNPHHDRSHVLVEDREDEEGDDEDDNASDAASVEQRKKLPWHKRPSPLWFLIMVPLAAAATAATMAPKVEIYTQLACATHKPEYRSDNGTLPSTYGLLDEDKQRLCTTDPVVQAAVARMNIAMAMTLGVLTCLTAAWWGSLSDRFGRIRVMSFAVFGLLMTDVNFLVVSRFHEVLPGGYWFLLVGPFLDGLLGGIAAVSASMHAYVADCTEQGERSHIFSLFLGLTFSGFGFGPTLGAIIIHLSGTVLSVFYFATAIHLLYAALVIFVIPESLSKRRMLEARRLRREQLEEAKYGPQPSFMVGWTQSLFSFMKPLEIFKPTNKMVSQLLDGSDVGPFKTKAGGADWNLLLVAMAYGFTLSVMGAYPYKFQYTTVRFGWSSEQIGYWLSIVGITRAAYLTVLLPLIIKLLKRFMTPAVQLPISPNEPLQPDSSPSEDDESTPQEAPKASRSITFDFNLARVSLAIEVVSYAMIPFAPTAVWYTVFTMIGSFGSGFGPALQSVALGLYTLRGGTESGKLFGAMSVVQSLCSQVLGPGLYGMTYMMTVKTYPATIFFVTSSAVFLSFICLSLVRMPKETVSDLEGLDIASDDRTVYEDGVETPDPDVPTVVVEDVNGKAISPSPSS